MARCGIDGSDESVVPEGVDDIDGGDGFSQSLGGFDEQGALAEQSKVLDSVTELKAKVVQGGSERVRG